MSILLMVVFEVALGIVVLLVYTLMRSLLLRVAQGAPGAQSNLRLALAWSVWWASLYTIPLGVVVWLGHLVAIGGR